MFQRVSFINNGLEQGYNSYLEYIKNLPIEAKPEVFNLHENADITKNQLETDNFFKTILLTQGKSESSGARSNEQIVSEVVICLLYV